MAKDDYVPTMFETVLGIMEPFYRPKRPAAELLRLSPLPQPDPETAAVESYGLDMAFPEVTEGEV